MLTNKVNQASVQEVVARQAPVFLDTRKKEEYLVSHLPGAMHVGFKNFPVKKLEGIAAGADIVVYCTIGFRSERIARKLQQAGYTNVTNLYGGIFEWVNQGNPVYIGTAQTNRVHVFNKLWARWLRNGEKVF